MLEIIMCGLLIALIMLIMVVFAVVGILMAYGKVFDRKPKSEPPPLSDDERARIERAEKKRIRQEQNFWNYDGFKQDEII
jgi:hypothetical protein